MNLLKVPTDHHAIIARNLWLAKRGVDILRGCDLTIPRGFIYGLLGPSGCGKTTFLRCLIGYSTYDSGTLSIFGHSQRDMIVEIPGRNVGYMPQEIGLYADITIEETLIYFGRIFQLNWNMIQHQIKKMIEILELPNIKKFIKNLSGGQKRRVSLAACLIHKPMLLILDEPTAGVDPLLRKKIWTYLISLSNNEKVTVIITTHYIEESRRANRIGLMRKGQILSEDTPEEIMRTSNCSSIQDAFLALCMRRRSTRSSIDRLKLNKEKKDEISWLTLQFHKKPLLVRISEWFVIFFALVHKNLKMDLRNPLSFCLQFFSPLTQIFLFALCIGGTPFDIKLGIYNAEKTSFSLGSQFINFIKSPFFTKVFYDDLETAMADVKTKKIWGVLVIPTDYSYGLIDRECFNVTNETIAASTLTLHADLSDKIIALTSYQSLSHSLFRFCRVRLQKLKLNANLCNPYLDFREPIYGRISQKSYSGLKDFMLPGITVNVIFACAVAITAITLVGEKKAQTLERNYVCGITSCQMLLAHACGLIILTLPCVLIVVYLPLHIFKIEYTGSLNLVTLIVIFQNITGMMCGIAVAAICNDLIMCMFFTSSIYVLNTFSSGALWPLESIPYYFRFISFSQPPTTAIEAYRSILYRGWNLTYFKIWLSFVINFIWCKIFFLFGAKFFFRW